MAGDNTSTLKSSNVPTFVSPPDGPKSFMIGPHNPTSLPQGTLITPIGHTEMTLEIAGESYTIDTTEGYTLNADHQSLAEDVQLSESALTSNYQGGLTELVTTVEDEGSLAATSDPNLAPGTRTYGYDTTTGGAEAVGDVELAVTFFPIEGDTPTIAGKAENALFEDLLVDGIGANESVSGSLSFSFGDDGPGSVTIAPPSVTDPETGFGMALTSCFETVSWELLDVVDGQVTLQATASGMVIAEMTIDINAQTYTYTQIKPFDHPDIGAAGSEIGLDDPLQLVFDFTVTDVDGDSVSSTITINVYDDGPEPKTTDGGMVAEENLVGEGSYEDDLVLSLHGALNVDYRADTPGLITGLKFNSAMDLDGVGEGQTPFNGELMVCGEPVVFGEAEMVGNHWVLIGTVDLGDGSIEVIKLMVEKSGVGEAAPEFWFELLHAIDHPDAGAQGSEVGFYDQLQLKFDYETTDKDGDSVWNVLTVAVKDDGPSAGDEMLQIDETLGEGVAALGMDEISPEDYAVQLASIQSLLEIEFSDEVPFPCNAGVKMLWFDYGADGAGEIEYVLAFEGMSSGLYTDGDVNPQEILLQYGDGGANHQVVVGYTNDDEESDYAGEIAFIAVLQDDGQTYFVQYEEFNHTDSPIILMKRLAAQWH